MHLNKWAAYHGVCIVSCTHLNKWAACEVSAADQSFVLIERLGRVQNHLWGRARARARARLGIRGCSDSAVEPALDIRLMRMTCRGLVYVSTFSKDDESDLSRASVCLHA